jgi:anti-sigma regulatory factor (Ser/Thr protein kinase)
MPVAEVTLEATPASVAAARAFLARKLHDWDVDALEWPAAQVLSELATNAVIHAGTDFTVLLVLDGEQLRLEVRDGSSRVPRQRHYGVNATTGRGLALVGALSAEWGIARDETGKTVWCVLLLTRDGEDADVDLDAFLTADDLVQLQLPPRPGPA